MKKLMMAFLAILILNVCFLSASFSFSEELMPEPGTVIDKTNYNKYAHLFPEEFLPIFEDGFGGLMEPASITVGEPRLKCPLPKEFQDLSTENKGKYSLDSDGNLIGGWNRNGFPFPDLKRSDQDFVTKLMWNYSGRYQGTDDAIFDTINYVQRKGERARYHRVLITWLFFINRLMVPPTPIKKTPNDVAHAIHFLHNAPISMKNMQTLSLRYMDPQKPDETYIYVPSLRRVIRGDSGQRSVPMLGHIASLDDLYFFDGKTEQFTYKLVGEQIVLDAQLDFSERALDPKGITIPSDGWFPVKVYVIDIEAKNPTYPQKKRRIWMDKSSLMNIYCVTWDRAGELWKVWHMPNVRFPLGDTCVLVSGPNSFGIDLQFGMMNNMSAGSKLNPDGLSYEDVSPSAMVKKAR